MALKILKDIEDATGTVRSEIYTNVGKRYTYIKDRELLVLEPEYWATEEDHADSKKPIQIDNGIGHFIVTVVDASGQLLFDFLYEPYILALIAEYGLVQGELLTDKTGSWEEVTIP